MKIKILALTGKELYYLQELVDAVSPNYGPTFNTERFHSEYEDKCGPTLTEEELQTLYGKLMALDKQKEEHDEPLEVAKTITLECHKKASEQVKWLDDVLEELNKNEV